MLTHVTETDVVYEVAIPQAEVLRRMATLIKALYPTFLELRASACEAEGQTGEANPTRIASDPRPRPRVHGS